MPERDISLTPVRPSFLIIKVGDVELRYAEARGAGPPLLLHGLFGSERPGEYVSELREFLTALL